MISITIKKIQCINTIKGEEPYNGEKATYTPTNWTLALLFPTERFALGQQRCTQVKYLF